MIRVAALIAVLGASLLPAQVRLSLAEAAARNSDGLALRHAGEAAVLRGTVAAGPVLVTDYAHLAIQEGSGAGFVIEAPLAQLEGLRPGDVIEVQGTITHRAGLPVLRPGRIQRISQEPPPKPQLARIADLNSPDLLGRWVETEGVVRLSGSNRGGEILRISGGDSEITVFFPFLAKRRDGLSRYQPGDRVRVRGIASQYSPLPPHRGSYQIMIGDAGWVSLIRRRSLLPPWSAGVGLGAVLLVLLLWYARERRMATYPRRMRRLYNLGETLLSCRGLEQSVRLLTENLPSLLGVTSVRLYLHEPVTSTLRQMGSDAAGAPVSLKLPQGFRGRALSLCFYNRTPIVIPDSRRSPLLEEQEAVPRSLLAVPMLAQGQPLGVLELTNEDRPCGFSEDEVAVVQHLANQIAIGMRLLERDAMREQAAGNQQYKALLHVAETAVRELDAWLHSTRRTDAGDGGSGAEPAAQPSVGLPPRVVGALERLRRFCAPAAEPGAPVDFAALVRRVLDRYVVEWRNLGLDVEEHLTQESLRIAGVHSPWLEELVTTLLAGATRITSQTGAGGVYVRLGRFAGTVLLEAGAVKNGAARPPDPFEEPAEEAGGSLPLAVARALARNWGGDLRWNPDAPSGPSLELDLPLSSEQPRRPTAEATAGSKGRVLTVLLLEPNDQPRQALLSLIGSAGHRCVATAEPEQAWELLLSKSFDAFFCAQDLSGRAWGDFYDLCLRAAVRFVLLSADRGLPEKIPTAGGAGLTLVWPGPQEKVFEVLAQVQAELEAADGYNGE